MCIIDACIRIKDHIDMLPGPESPPPGTRTISWAPFMTSRCFEPPPSSPDALVALDALLRGVSHQLSLHHCTGSSRSSGLNSAERDLLAQLLPPCLKAPPRSGEELRSQFVTQEIKMLSPKRGQSQGCCWSLGHISQHHRWSSAGPMCKHYQPKSKESVVNL